MVKCFHVTGFIELWVIILPRLGEIQITSYTLYNTLSRFEVRIFAGDRKAKRKNQRYCFHAFSRQRKRKKKDHSYFIMESVFFLADLRFFWKYTRKLSIPNEVRFELDMVYDVYTCLMVYCVDAGEIWHQFWNSVYTNRLPHVDTLLFVLVVVLNSECANNGIKYNRVSLRLRVDHSTNKKFNWGSLSKA